MNKVLRMRMVCGVVGVAGGARLAVGARHAWLLASGHRFPIKELFLNHVHHRGSTLARRRRLGGVIRWRISTAF